MTEQKIFNKVAKHLLSQRAKSWDSNYKCLYRGLDNTKCAVGCLIKDKDYSLTLENSYFFAAKSLILEALSKSLGETISKEKHTFIGELQPIHDYREVEEWPMELMNFAECYGLSTTYLESLLK